MDQLTAETVDLLRAMIRNGCVNRSEVIDGEMITEGHEHRNRDVLASVLEGCGLDLEVVESPGARPALLARMEGSDPDAPSLALVGHMDVVPADEDGWRHDPFGGELVDGEVWGRGALDMLNQTSAMAVALRSLALDGFRPRGDLVFAAVPDEEAGGRRGMKPLIDSHPDLILTDYALSEVGGAVQPTVDGGALVEGYISDKGGSLVLITVRGTPGHTSLPYGSDNAVVKAAEVVRRLSSHRPRTMISDHWRAWVAHQEFEPEVAALLVDPDRLWDGLPGLPPTLAAKAHACTHTTFVPTTVEGGGLNQIPHLVHLRLSFRVPLGESHGAVMEEIRGLIEDLVDPADVVLSRGNDATLTPTDTPLWDVLCEATAHHHPGATLVPSLLQAWTDASHLRNAGVAAYGFGVLSTRIAPDDYWARFHGRDERVDIESLELSRLGWEYVCRRFLA
jgi:acetylornithine deacetylase/succinyl-diaminopimelate desuccinylase-like protein